MSVAKSLFPDPASLIQRLRRLGLVDSTVCVTNTTEVFGLAFVGQHQALDSAEVQMGANVAASCRDTCSRLEVQISAYAEPEPGLPGSPLRPLVETLRGLFMAADQPFPVSISGVLAEQMAPQGVGVPAGPASRHWDLGGAQLEWSRNDEDEALVAHFLTLWRPLAPAEWKEWMGAGGVLEGVVAKDQKDHARLLSRVARVLAAHGHPLTEQVASMRVFLVSDDGEAGVSAIVQSQTEPRFAIYCLEPRERTLASVAIEVVHPDGRLERLSA